MAKAKSKAKAKMRPPMQMGSQTLPPPKIAPAAPPAMTQPGHPRAKLKGFGNMATAMKGRV